MRVAKWSIIAVVGMACASVGFAEEILTEPEAIAKIEQLGGKVIDGRPRTGTSQHLPIPVVVIPFLPIVIALSLVSAYLLLSKTRPTNPRSSSI